MNPNSQSQTPDESGLSKATTVSQDTRSFAVSGVVGQNAVEQEHPEWVHIEDPLLRELPVTFANLARFPLLALIRLYQMTLSRLLPSDTCRFYPSCSHYGYQAIYKYGAVKGSLMAGWRVLRCNPFNKGGFDPVP